MKKLFAIVIALSMMFTVLAVSASAATSTNTYKLIYMWSERSTGAIVTIPNIADGQELIVKENHFVNHNTTRVFTHWNTQKDGSGDSYYPGDKFIYNAANASSAGVIMLYTQWETIAGYHVTYDKNTTDPACTGNITDPTEYGPGATVTLRYINEGFETYNYPLHKFVEWNTKADGTGTGYQPGQTFSITGDTTMYAIWENVEQEVTFFTVKYDANGGEGEMFEETDIPAGGSVMAPDCEFTYDGYVFENWNTKADGTGDTYEAWDDVPVDSDLVLYAMWTEAEDWMFDPDDGEGANIAIAVAVSTLALGAIFVVAKKEIED